MQQARLSLALLLVGQLASLAAGFQVPALHGAVGTRSTSRPAMGGLRMASGADRLLLKLPGAKESFTLVAKTVELDQTEVVEAPKAAQPGLKANKNAMGQSPFWVGAIFIVLIAKMVRQKASGRSVLDNKDAKFIPQNEEELKQLKVFACEDCGYELMPARGREGKFFAKDFKCPICGAPKEKFWDINDPNDPRNQVQEEEEAVADDKEKGKKGEAEA